MRFIQLLALFVLTLTPLFANGLESFEALPTGEKVRMETVVGTITAAPGNIAITDKAKTGNHSLRILGGVNKSFTLTLTKPEDVDIPIFLWAERWTNRNPFHFKIEAETPGGLRTIYNGDKTIKVQGFQTEVKAVIPRGTKVLRFTATTPDNTGMMIDDILIMPTVPMKITASRVRTNVYPVMVRMDFNPLLQIIFSTYGVLSPNKITQAVIDFSGTTNIQDIESISLVAGDARPEGKLLDDSITITNPASDLVTMKGKLPLRPGQNHIWLSVKLKPNTSIDNIIKARIISLDIDGKSFSLSDNVEATQRIGYAVTMPGDLNSKSYRIPGLIRSKAGTLIAVYDIRYNHSGDLPANIDVGVSRSTDGGKSWSTPAIAIDCGNDPQHRHDGVGDPAILVDHKTGRIWVAALWSHGDNAWHGSKPGIKPEETGQFVLAYSDDDGITWSKPINITPQVKDPKWSLFFNGPGNGICMKNGTLVFPAQYREAPGDPHNTKPFSTIIYSRDRGKTWKSGNGVKIDTTEAQVIELNDGSIMINARDNRGGSRTVGVTKNYGKTWELHPSDRNSLQEPVCQASIITVESKPHFKRAIFFSNPNTKSGRRDMTVKTSFDEGLTWPKENQLLYDSRNGYGYSNLVPIDNKYIGVIYEGRDTLFFLRFPYKDIIKKS